MIRVYEIDNKLIHLFERLHCIEQVQLFHG